MTQSSEMSRLSLKVYDCVNHINLLQNTVDKSFYKLGVVLGSTVGVELNLSDDAERRLKQFTLDILNEELEITKKELRKYELIND